MSHRPITFTALLAFVGLGFVFCEPKYISESKQASEQSFPTGVSSSVLKASELNQPASAAQPIVHFQQGAETSSAKSFNGAATVLPWNLKVTALRVGLFSGYNRVQANFLGDGIVGGASVDLMFGPIGLWATFATGQSSTKTHNLQTADYSIAFKGGGTIGSLTGRAGLRYSYELFPKLLMSLGVGIEYARYNTAYITLGAVYSPVIVPGVSYDFSKTLSVGLEAPLSRVVIPNITANGLQYTLLSKEEILAAQFIMLLRYRIL